MEYPIILFNGSFALGTFTRGAHRNNNNSGITIDILSRQTKIGADCSDMPMKPYLALEFEKDESIEGLIGRLEYIRDYKYRMFEEIIMYKGILVEA